MPNPSPEMGPMQGREVQPIAPERAPQPRTAEIQADSRERLEVQQPVSADPIVVPAIAAQPFLPAPTPSASAPTAQPGTPLVAADDDLIEKEWVDKAKKIIQETKSDPYAQEKEVSKLQADYVKKRYGKDIKLPNE